MDCNLPGSPVHGILQARLLEWVAILFPGDLPNPVIEPVSPVLAGGFFTTEPCGKPQNKNVCYCVKLLELCLTLCDIVDCKPPGSSKYSLTILEDRSQESVSLTWWEIRESMARAVSFW